MLVTSKVSYILAFEHEREITLGHILRRLIVFGYPILVLAILCASAIVRTGEVLPVRWVAAWRNEGRPYLYLPEFSDHLYRYKLEVALRERPEILVIGSSRSNQWRSKMFKGRTFYNAGNSMYLPEDYGNVLDELGDYAPAILIFSLDGFMFNQGFADEVKERSKADIDGDGFAELKHITLKVIDRIKERPSQIFSSQVEPIYGLPALGYHAIRQGIGFRFDGSLQYGDTIKGEHGLSPQDMAAKIRRNEQIWPIWPGREMVASFKGDFEKFVKRAKEKGIQLVAVTPAVHPDVVAALGASPNHGYWRQFRSPETKRWIRSLGVQYFDFTDIASFDGSPEEFVDSFHPSEPAYLRMFMKMLQDKSIAELFRTIDVDEFSRTLSTATRYEAFRNEF